MVAEVKFTLSESDRFMSEGVSNWGQGDKRRLYDVTGVRCVIDGPQRSWSWLGYPCTRDGDRLRGAKEVGSLGIPERVSACLRKKLVGQLVDALSGGEE